MDSQQLVTEIPSSLKQLARLVVRGFFTLEDSLIIDMLVRNPCMKEDDICELLKFEKKMLRAKITTLKNDKFLQSRLRMETGADGKAQKVNYYFINYKVFVNMVKYRLDHMRKRMETEERDATSRASFKCPSCQKTFTDLEADQLFDPMSQEFRCTFCSSVVEEDECAAATRDSKVLLATFNQQMGPLYELLQRVEDIRLAPEVLEPEPTDISALKGDSSKDGHRAPGEGAWSGEASRRQGFHVEETRVDITIGDAAGAPSAQVRKERPIWMVESTVAPIAPEAAEIPEVAPMPAEPTNKAQDDIMAMLLAHEKKSSAEKHFIPGQSDSDSESSDAEMENVEAAAAEVEAGMMDVEEEDHVPTVTIGDQEMRVTDVTDDIIAKMTSSEKETYIAVYQDYFSSIYD